MAGSSHPSPGAAAGHRADLPTSMQLIGAVVRAFEATKDLPPNAVCDLSDKTSQRGFRGECKTRRWCCRLTALFHFLVHHELVLVPAVDGTLIPFHHLVLMPQLIMWDRLRDSDVEGNVTAMLRYFTATMALRVGTLLGATSWADELPSAIRAPEVWANPRRRAEPLKELFVQAGTPTQRSFAEALGYDEDTVTNWLRHGQRPDPHALEVLSVYFEQQLSGQTHASIMRRLRWHYALSDIAERVASLAGQEAVEEMASVFAGVVACGFHRLRTEPLPDEAREGMVGVAVHIFQKMPTVEPIVHHIKAHGASEEFQRDVESAHAVWRRVLPDDAEEPQVELIRRHFSSRR